MSEAPPTSVWIGIRADGVEMTRVKAAVVEIERGNGVATMTTLGPVHFPAFPRADDPLLTVSVTEHATPFVASHIDQWWKRWGDSEFELGYVKFEIILDVPRYVPPPKAERKRWRTRLSAN